MDETERRLEDLFNRYYNSTATPEQREELMAYIRTAKSNELIEKFLKENWNRAASENALFTPEKSHEILDSILSKANRKEASQPRVFRLTWLRYAAAAALLLIGIGFWWQFRADQQTGTGLAVQKAQKPNDVRPGGNRALLTLADGSAIELDRVGSGLLARQGTAEIRKTGDGILVYSAKATPAGPDGRMNTLTTPKGGQYEVSLPDGSKVWLNASSSIRFPSVFPASERKVEITGEAYFEVAKNKAKPFRVKFNTSEVQVLGTQFNVMAYPEEGASKTTLVEGSVQISHRQQHTALRPGQQAVVSANGQINTKYTSVDQAVAWRNGLFYFKDAGIEEVMRQLARWYDVEIEFGGKIPVRQFTGKIARNVNLSEVTHMLRYAGVNCRIEGKKIVIDS
ncbi:FecR family protein [Larkinella arboricola]|uniref:FecR family protein n=1 Tax=Larkinella arboricola TaxID=643671 RepID=A0A327X6D9_LARAB|nr:FecR family protein [Larkinella arboricola]RAK02291.1 FecR family protein [Larkinella arboricola]